MTRIETSHNGHVITYAENEDVWRCWDMNIEAKTLSAIKAKLNKVEADARRCNVPVIVLHRYGCEVDAIGIATVIDGKDVWVSSKDTRGRAVRSKKSMGSILLDTPENRAAIKAATARRREGDKIIKEANAMWSAIPRVTPEALKSLPPKQEEKP
jgi:hypothetical protein